MSVHQSGILVFWLLLYTGLDENCVDVVVVFILRYIFELVLDVEQILKNIGTNVAA